MTSRGTKVEITGTSRCHSTWLRRYQKSAQKPATDQQEGKRRLISTYAHALWFVSWIPRAAVADQGLRHGATHLGTQQALLSRNPGQGPRPA